VVVKKTDEVAGSGIGAKALIDAPLNEEVSKSFLEYSMSVVYSRALPSIIDGLKPVQRRILYSMHEEGYTPEKSFVKSAKPVASTMGNYHPHGDSSIYMALVKLAQPFYINVPLVEGYGNFGDVTGSGPAASRYTECKLSRESVLLLSELKENTVQMRPNYSDDAEEPAYLPVQFPNLLINGNFGIAVGFASNFAQHNGQEAINAAKYLLKHPDATVEQLMKYIPGPDFPTGGQIIGTDGILSAYKTGQGIIKLRGTYTIVPTGRGKHEIIFTELPYGTKTETVITKIKDALKVGKLTGIADASDLTDHDNGLKFVIEVKAGVNAPAIVNELFRLTPLEDSFGINNTCLVDGEPKTVGLQEILQSFLNHRFDIVTRRTMFRKEKRDARLHLIEGLLKALANIDEVIKIIRNAADTATAREALIKKFKLDEIQADYILDIPLRRLTKYDQIQLNDEKAKLIEELVALNKILNDKEELKAVVGKELDEVKKVLTQERRSVIVDGNLAEHVEAAKIAAKTTTFEIEDEAIFVGVHVDGSLSRSNKAGALNGKKVPLLSVVPARSRGKIVVITDKGKGYRVDSVNIKEDGLTKGSLVAHIASDETIIGVLPAGEEAQSAGVGVFLATRDGNVKIAQPAWPVRSDEFEVISLAAGDTLLTAKWVTETVEGGEIAILTTDTSLLKFSASKVRPQGLSGAGVTGIKLGAGQTVLTANYLTAAEVETAEVVTFTGTSVKRTPYKIYPEKGRATGGVRSHKFLKGEETLTAAGVFSNPVAVTSAGKKVDLPPVDNRRDGSGVKIIDAIATIAQL